MANECQHPLPPRSAPARAAGELSAGLLGQTVATYTHARGSCPRRQADRNLPTDVVPAASARAAKRSLLIDATPMASAHTAGLGSRWRSWPWELDHARHGGAPLHARSRRMGRCSAMVELDPGPTMGSSTQARPWGAQHRWPWGEAASVTARTGWDEPRAWEGEGGRRGNGWRAALPRHFCLAAGRG